MKNKKKHIKYSKRENYNKKGVASSQVLHPNTGRHPNTDQLLEKTLYNMGMRVNNTKLLRSHLGGTTW